MDAEGEMSDEKQTFEVENENQNQNNADLNTLKIVAPSQGAESLKAANPEIVFSNESVSDEEIQNQEVITASVERDDDQFFASDQESSHNSELEEQLVSEIVSRVIESAQEILRKSHIQESIVESEGPPDVNQCIAEPKSITEDSHSIQGNENEFQNDRNVLDIANSVNMQMDSIGLDGNEYSDTGHQNECAVQNGPGDESQDAETSSQRVIGNLTSLSQGNISETVRDDHSTTTSGGIVNIHVPYGLMHIHTTKGIRYEDVRQAHQASMLPSRVTQSLPNVPGFPASPSPTYKHGRMSKNSRSQLPRIMSPSSSYPVGFHPRHSATSRRSPTRVSPRPPVNITKMSTVMDKTRRRTEKQREASVYFEERHYPKILTLDQCINSRPPMQFDLEGPGPQTYSTPRQPLYETNAPKYTFGMKFHERNGGGRTAWAKTWYNSQNNFTVKVNFEKRWPTPATHISSRSMVGRRVAFKPEFPAHSIGVRTNFSISKPGSEKEPSPNEYNISKSDDVKFKKAPAFSMTFRHRGTSLWGGAERTPPPDWYTPRLGTSTPHHPAFTIRGIRRPKSHVLGPHSTL